MQPKAFISYSYANRDEFKSFDVNLRQFLANEMNIDAYSFVFDFKSKATDQTLMKAALEKIDESDFLIAELSYKSIGIGIEAGYAKAKNKKIIYIHQKGTEISTTVNGICDSRIEYKNERDLFKKLKNALD